MHYLIILLAIALLCDELLIIWPILVASNSVLLQYSVQHKDLWYAP